MNRKLDYWEKQKTKHNTQNLQVSNFKVEIFQGFSVKHSHSLLYSNCVYFYFYLDLFCVRHTFVLSCVKKKNVKVKGKFLKSYTQKTEREKLSLPIEVATTLKFKVREVD